MALTQVEQALQGAEEQLEQRVVERTAELSRINLQLRKELTQISSLLR
jgi:C4-dicarboxylate-specific signal transduction histidine kinase